MQCLVCTIVGGIIGLLVGKFLVLFWIVFMGGNQPVI